MCCIIYLQLFVIASKLITSHREHTSAFAGTLFDQCILHTPKPSMINMKKAKKKRIILNFISIHLSIVCKIAIDKSLCSRRTQSIENEMRTEWTREKRITYRLVWLPLTMYDASHLTHLPFFSGLFPSAAAYFSSFYILLLFFLRLSDSFWLHKMLLDTRCVRVHAPLFMPDTIIVYRVCVCLQYVFHNALPKKKREIIWKKSAACLYVSIKIRSIGCSASALFSFGTAKLTWNRKQRFIEMHLTHLKNSGSPVYEQQHFVYNQNLRAYEPLYKLFTVLLNNVSKSKTMRKYKPSRRQCSKPWFSFIRCVMMIIISVDQQGWLTLS